MRQHYLLGSKTHIVETTKNKMSSRKTNDIETLSERLGSLQIDKEASDEYEQTSMEDMSVATSTSSYSSQQEHPGRIAKEYGTGPRVV